MTKTAHFGQYLSEFSMKLPQTTTNHDTDHYKWWHESSQITTNHHKPWHKPPWTMTETSTKHDMNHYKSPQTMTWTIMMTQKELCIKPYGFLVSKTIHCGLNLTIDSGKTTLEKCTNCVFIIIWSWDMAPWSWHFSSARFGDRAHLCHLVFDHF